MDRDRENLSSWDCNRELVTLVPSEVTAKAIDIPTAITAMSVRTRISCRSFGGRSAVERRFSVGSLTLTATDEVIHFVRRRRSTSIGGAA